MTRRLARPVAALAVAASLSACAHEPFDDPLFWHAVALGAEVAALAVALDDDCWTRYDRHGYAYTVCDDDLPPPPPHRPRRPRP
ncbi:MAG: hypothetical protein KJ676_05965 [Alphaproteobacteria bacterium]|nr:hypothetical protein [Alphaproteobacteria bacterium]MBU1526976.1 hypothetical protein [Alphaproteobacteria bacterium]MBU2118448.1 hypothetical protein [Alphaproteobacteria bacterium]MBU2352119.1 hypothetical protein [Alphaproteobacteria bacterium]MBU2381596.1 hypothetical protein [Alphaproteobacteria bacterium]